MTVRIISAIIRGFHAIKVTIKVDCDEGYGLKISGLITQTVYRDISRIQLALLNCGFGIKNKKFHIEVEPAIYDNAEALMLPIATAILIAAGKISNHRLSNYLIAGGLGVTGNIHEFDGMQLVCKLAMNKNIQGIILPHFDASVYDFVYSMPVYQFKSLDGLLEMFNDNSCISQIELPKSIFENLNYN